MQIWSQLCALYIAAIIVYNYSSPYMYMYLYMYYDYTLHTVGYVYIHRIF